jgi:hypothetical protein
MTGQDQIYYYYIPTIKHIKEKKIQKKRKWEKRKERPGNPSTMACEAGCR